MWLRAHGSDSREDSSTAVCPVNRVARILSLVGMHGLSECSISARFPRACFFLKAAWFYYEARGNLGDHFGFLRPFAFKVLPLDTKSTIWLASPSRARVPSHHQSNASAWIPLSARIYASCWVFRCDAQMADARDILRNRSSRLGNA